MSDLSGLFTALLEMVGLSVEESSDRIQAQVLLAFGAVFGVVAGIITVDLASQMWFVIAGLCGITFLLVTFLKSE